MNIQDIDISEIIFLLDMYNVKYEDDPYTEAEILLSSLTNHDAIPQSIHDWMLAKKLYPVMLPHYTSNQIISASNENLRHLSQQLGLSFVDKPTILRILNYLHLLDKSKDKIINNTNNYESTPKNPLKYESSLMVPIVQNIDRYGELVSELGRGTFGIVNLHKNTHTGEMYAIKNIVGYHDPSAALIEIAYMVRMNHPNINKLEGISFSYDDDWSFQLIMPYMASNLSRMIHDDVLFHNKGKIIKYLYDIVVGVAYMHSRDILHRDLKSANILYDISKDSMIIADFGLAIMLRCPYLNEEISPNVITSLYRPPELFMEVMQYGDEVDIWSLGVILYEMLTGELLFITPTYDPFTNIRELFGVQHVTYPNDLFNLPLIDIGQILPNLKHSPYIELFNMTLQPNPKNRATIFDIMQNNIFDVVRRKNLEALQLSMLDNLHLRDRYPLHDRFKNSLNLNSSIRNTLIGWLMSVHASILFPDTVLSLAQIYIDIYLPLDIQRNNIQLFGMICYSIASKIYMDINLYDESDFIYLMDNVYTMEQFNDMYKRVFDLTQLDLIQSTPIDFICEYMQNYYSDDPNLKKMAKCIYFISMYGKFTTKNHILALWAIYYACEVLDIDYKNWDLYDPRSETQQHIKLFSKVLSFEYNIGLKDIFFKNNIDFRQTLIKLTI